jgi:hypothetical protein
MTRCRTKTGDPYLDLNRHRNEEYTNRNIDFDLMTSLALVESAFGSYYY